MLQSSWLREHLGIEMQERDVSALRAMDNPANVTRLAEVGAAAAAGQVRDDHFPAHFDIPGAPA